MTQETKGWVLGFMMKDTLPRNGLDQPFFLARNTTITSDIGEAHVHGSKHAAEFHNQRQGFNFEVMSYEEAEAKYLAKKLCDD